MSHVLLFLLLAQTQSQAPAQGGVAVPLPPPPSATLSDVAVVAELFGAVDRELRADEPDAARLNAAFARAVEGG